MCFLSFLSACFYQRKIRKYLKQRHRILSANVVFCAAGRLWKYWLSRFPSGLNSWATIKNFRDHWRPLRVVRAGTFTQRSLRFHQRQVFAQDTCLQAAWWTFNPLVQHICRQRNTLADDSVCNLPLLIRALHRPWVQGIKWAVYLKTFGIYLQSQLLICFN